MPTDSYTLHRRRVKYARIYINYDLEIRVVVPTWFRQVDLERFISDKTPWIRKTIAHYKELRSQAPQLQQGELLYLGKTVPVSFDTTDKTAVEKWYKIAAKKYFAERLEQLAFQHGFTYNRFSIRASKTRWGSCSTKKNITLNWHLMKAPDFIIDYLILHELTHTEIMNHSRKYWKRVAEVCPFYEEAKIWLRKHGNSLH